MSPRLLHPDLLPMLERHNPRTRVEVEISAPDAGRVLRRADDEFFTATPAGPLVSMTPPASLAASAAGAIQIAPTALTLLNVTGTGSSTDVRRFPADTRLKALGWELNRAFDAATLRAFSIKVKRNPVFGLLPRSAFQLQIWRATGVQGVLRYENGASTPRTEWTFTPLLSPAAVVPKSAVAWAGDNTAVINFDLAPWGIELRNAPPRGNGEPAIERNVYYFQIEAIDLPLDADDWITWYIDTGGVRTVAGVGTFRRRWWVRDDPNAEWVEQLHDDCYHATLTIDNYAVAGGVAEAIYAIDLGQVPGAASSGRVVFERAQLAANGQDAELALSTAGAGGPYTVVKHGDAVAVKQQLYHLRLRLRDGTQWGGSTRRSPRVHALGLEFRTPYDVSHEALIEAPSFEVGVPFLGSAIPEGRVTLLRTGARDYADTATALASRSAPSTLEVDTYLSSDHPTIGRAQRFLLDRMKVSQRAPRATAEVFTTLGLSQRTKRTIPAKVETINSVHTVVAGTTAAAIKVTPVLPGSSVSGNEYDGQGYYIRVRASAQAGVVGQIYEVAGNTGTDQLDIAGGLPAVLQPGDVIELHSARYVQPRLVWQDADPADIWEEVLVQHLGVPKERVGLAGMGKRGGLPPKVTDICPGDAATQAKRRVTRSFDEGVEANELLDQLGFILGGTLTEIGGQIVFRQIYPMRDASGAITVAPDAVADVFDPRDTIDLDTPAGLEQRATMVSCAYGKNYAAADPDAFPASTTVYVDADALNFHTQQDLEAFGTAEIDEESAAWCYNSADQGLFLATQLCQQVVLACSTGRRVWSWGSTSARPHLCVGDRVTVITDQYTDYDPSARAPIKGWRAYTLVLIGVSEGGRRFRGYMLGLHNGSMALVGGPGSLAGAGQPIPIPGDFGVSVITQRSERGELALLRCAWTRPVSPWFAKMVYAVRSRPVGGSYAAPARVEGTQSGPDLIPAAWGLEYEVTPYTVTSDGVMLAGTPVVITVGDTPDPNPTFQAPAAGASSIAYAWTYDLETKRMEVWSKLFVADPGNLATVELAAGATRLDPIHRGDGRTSLALPVDAGNPWRVTTFIPYDRDGNRGAPITIKAQRNAAAAPPSAPTLAISSNPAGGPPVIRINLNGAAAGWKVRLYRDGVQRQEVTVAAGDVTNGYCLVPDTGTGPGSYTYTGTQVNATGLESGASAGLAVTVADTALAAPAGFVALRTNGIDIDLSWQPGGTYPPGTAYRLEKSLNGGAYFLFRPTVTGTSFADSDATPVIAYRVRAEKSGQSPSPWTTTSVAD